MGTVFETPNERAIQIQCDCGNWLNAETEVNRVRCECGRQFAVTVTDMGRISP